MSGRTPQKDTAEKTKVKSREPKHVAMRRHALADKGKPGEPKWVLRSFVLFLASIIIVPMYRVRVTGVENLPAGAYIMSPNHLSNMDAIVVIALTRRYGFKLRLLGKRNLWKFKPLAWIIDQAGALPISRDKADLDTMRKASNLLKAGDTIGIFPEGTRIRNEDMMVDKDHGLGEAHGGAAWLAIRNNVPVVPVGIAGTDRIRPDGMRTLRFPAVDVHFGEALVPDEVVPASEYAKKERIARLTDLVMEGIAASFEVARTDNAKRSR